MRLSFSILLITITLLGCDNYNPETSYAFLGGEIINANTNYVTIAKSKHVLDTIKLDGNNRFIYKIKNLKPGFYTFFHGGEFQLVLLEPKDSIMFRLNTLEFDESLVFTGTGAKKNNYLINEFLNNEINEKKIFKYCQLNILKYQEKIDSIKHKKQKALDKLKTKNNISDLFIKIAQDNIDYFYYFNKEIYPFAHLHGNKKSVLESIPENFYKYRKNINYNDNILKGTFIYNAFLRSNINNIALIEHYKHSVSNTFKNFDDCYTTDKLKLIDSLISDKNTKGNLLYRYTMKFLTWNNDNKNQTSTVNYFMQTSENKKDKENISWYVNALNRLKPGNLFPEIELTNSNYSEINISTIINTPTVICFWSQKNYNHFKESQFKIRDLRIKYPEIKFITINIDDYKTNSFVQTLKQNRFSIKNQYRLKNPIKSKKFLAIHPITKTFIIDRDKTIINSNTTIFAKHFEELLLGTINR